MTRVAVAQCAIGSDLQENLATCLRMLDKAAECKPDFVVLPEFSNHLSWYNDADHCYEVSLDLDSDFLKQIASKAKQINSYVSVGATLRRDNNTCSGSALLYSSAGELLGVADKQVLIGHENDFLTVAQSNAPIIETPHGRVAMYMCMDGVINETPRVLALRGAQLLLNSLNSFAPDEGNLHIPVRSPENKVFVAAANKVGYLVPEEMVEGISAATNIPGDFLKGAGESQVVAPDGTVLAMAQTADEEFVYADIDLSLADNKLRPDGTDIFASRRPELYSALAENPANQTLPEFKGAESVKSAVISSIGENALSDIKQAVESGAKLICLPELASGSVEINQESAQRCADFNQKVQALLGDGIYCASSAIVEQAGQLSHVSILLSNSGLVLEQGQLHPSNCFPSNSLVDGIKVFESEYGKLALCSSADSIYPETFRLIAIEGVELVFVPFRPQEQWEFTTGLVERAAENRVNMLVACAENPMGNSFSAALHEDFTIFTEWKSRKFDGVLTRPMLTEAKQGESLSLSVLHPKNAENKVVSHRTHLIDNRPWHLMSEFYGS